MTSPWRTCVAAALVVLSVGLVPGCRLSQDGMSGGPRDPALGIDLTQGVWHGEAIAYSGYRAGQSPKTGVRPSVEQVAEDLRLLAQRWRLIRVYKADLHAVDVLNVIREEELDLRVMLGIWLDREPGHEEENAENIADGIRLANEYDDVVVAVNVGNEILIEWTDHPVREERMIEYVREVRKNVSQPVTVADNYVWWRDEGADLAREVDFITIHTYPIFEGRDIDEGLSYTIENFDDVRQAHPDKEVVIGEAGWSTYAEDNLILPRVANERNQVRYHRELTEWARRNGVTVFFFEAFDEPWKGVGTESHWGLFTADREAKPAMQQHFSGRMPAGPTSPGYPDRIATVGPDISSVLRSDLASSIRGGSVNPLGPGVSESGIVATGGADDGAALELAFTGESWGGVYLLLGSHNASGAKTLGLRIKMSGEVEALELKLEGPATNASSVELMDYASGRDASGWTSFEVPLSDLPEVDLSRLSLLGLWNPSDGDGSFVACELILDGIYVE